MRKFIITIVMILSIFFLVAGLDAQPPLPKQEPVRYSPFNAVQLSKTDIIAVKALNSPDLDPTYMRYLSMHNIPEADRPLVKALVDMLLNSLNPQLRKIKRTAQVPGVGIPVLLRVNLYDYNISPKAWDRLAENGSGPKPLPDPYFHELIKATTDITRESVGTWTPTLLLSQVTGTSPKKCAIYVTAPGTYTVSFGGYAPEQTATDTTRDFTTKELAGPTDYTIQVKGSYEGIAYSLTKEFSASPGSRCNFKILPPSNEKIAEKGDVILSAASWLSIEQKKEEQGSTISVLIEHTQTKNPILRADWFCVYAPWAPAYYELIGLQLKDNPDKEAAKKKPKVFLEADFEKLMNVNKKSAERDIIAAITDTRMVTLHNRILLRFNTVSGLTGGYYWKSIDTDDGTDDQDYLNNVDKFLKPKFVASEIISSGRNGLNFYFVADAKGVGLDLAAAAVAQHTEAMPTKYQDKQVFVARNCMLCHAEGMIPLKDKVRSIARGDLALLIAKYTKDKDISRRIDEAFSPTPDPILETDNAKFIASVRAACGKEPKVIAKAQEELIWAYWDKKVTLERMACDSGVAPDKLKEALGEGVNLDYTLSSVLQDPEEPVALLTYERQGFGALMRYLIGYSPKKK